jgi:peptide deformylase
MIRPIVLYGHSVLREKCLPSNNKIYIKQIIEDLWDTVDEADGAGLAAPQIGEQYRVFVVNLKDYNWRQVFINPRMIKEDGETINMNEGCLSLPGIAGKVLRRDIIEMEWYDENWQYHRETFDGMESRVIQHEYDHLEGILWVDKVDTNFSRGIIKHLSNLKERNFDELDIDYAVI